VLARIQTLSELLFGVLRVKLFSQLQRLKLVENCSPLRELLLPLECSTNTVRNFSLTTACAHRSPSTAPGAGSSIPNSEYLYSKAACNDYFMFHCSNSTYGLEPCRANPDGTVELVQDLTPLSASSIIMDFTCMDGVHTLIRMANGTFFVTNGSLSYFNPVNTTGFNFTYTVQESNQPYTWVNHNGVLTTLVISTPFNFQRLVYILPNGNIYSVGDLFISTSTPYATEFVKALVSI